MNKPKKDRNFSIPKIKPVKFRDNLRGVELASRDAIDILNIFERQSMSETYNKDWKTEKVSMVENTNLETEYREKKKELKENGRTVRELSEHYGFLFVKDTYLMNKIVKEGLITKKVHYNPVGDGEHGVYVCKHPDVQLKIAISKNEDEAFIIVFKLVLGRCKAVQPQTNVVGEPMPNYDSYTSSLPAQASDAFNTQNARSQIYIYEYSDEALPLKRPRHCLPYAVVKFIRKQTKGGHAPMPIVSHRRLSDYSQEYKPGTYGARNKALKRSSLDNRMPNPLPSLMSLSSTDNLVNRGYNMPRPSESDRYKAPDHLSYNEGFIATNTSFKTGLNDKTALYQDNTPVTLSSTHHLDVQLKKGTEDYDEELKCSEFQGKYRDSERLYSNSAIDIPVDYVDKPTSKTLPQSMRIKKKEGASVVYIKQSPMRRNNLVIEKLDYIPSVSQPVNGPTSSQSVKPHTSSDKNEDALESTVKPNDNAANIQKMINTVNKIFGKVPSQESPINMDEGVDVSVVEEDIKGPHTGYVVAPVENEPYEEEIFVEDNDSMSDDDYMPVIRSPLLSKAKEAPNCGQKELGYVQNLAEQLQSLGDIKEVLSKLNFVNDQPSKSYQTGKGSSSTDDLNRDLMSYAYDNKYGNEKSNSFYQDDHERQPFYVNPCKDYTSESCHPPEERTQSLETNRSSHSYFSERHSSDLYTHSENLHVPDKRVYSENIHSSDEGRYSENLHISDRNYENKHDWTFSSNKNDQFSTNHFGDIDYRRKPCVVQNSYTLMPHSYENYENFQRTFNTGDTSHRLWNYQHHYQRPSSSYSNRDNQALESYSTISSSPTLHPPQESPILHDHKGSGTSRMSEKGILDDMSGYSTTNLSNESRHTFQEESKSPVENECMELDMKTLNSCNESTDISDSKSVQCKETKLVSPIQEEDKMCEKRNSQDLCVPVEACEVIVVDLCQIGNRRLHHCTTCSAQFDLLTGNLKYSNRKRKRGIGTYLKEKGVRYKTAARKVKKPKMNKTTATMASNEPKQQESQLEVDSNLLQNVKSILDGMNSKNQVDNRDNTENLCPEEISTKTKKTYSLTPVDEDYGGEDFSVSSQKETSSTTTPLSTTNHTESSSNDSNNKSETQPHPPNQVTTTSPVSVSTVSSTTNIEPMIESRRISDEDYVFQQHFRHEIDSLSAPETQPTSLVNPVVDKTICSYSSQADVNCSEIEKCAKRNDAQKDIEIPECISTINHSNNSGDVHSVNIGKSSLLSNDTAHIPSSSISTTSQQFNICTSPMSPGNDKLVKIKSDGCDSDNISPTKRHFRKPSNQHPPHLARNPSPPREITRPTTQSVNPDITSAVINNQSEDERDTDHVKSSLLSELKVVKESIEKVLNTSESEIFNLMRDLTYFKSVAKGNMSVECLKDALQEVERELVMSLQNDYYMHRPNERIPAPVLFDHEIKSVYATGGCFLYLNTFMSRRLYDTLLQMKEKILEVYHEKKKSKLLNDRVESLNDQLDALLTKRKLLLRTLTGSVKDSRLRQLEKSKRNFLISLEYIKKSGNVKSMTYLEKLYTSLSQHASVVKTELDMK